MRQRTSSTSALTQTAVRLLTPQYRTSFSCVEGWLASSSSISVEIALICCTLGK